MIPSLLLGQFIPVGYDTTSIAQEIVVDGNICYSGTSIQKDITSKFIWGGFISEDIKDASFNKHRAVNRLGGVLSGQIEYRNFNKRLIKSKNWGYLIKGGYDVFMGALYSKDLFGLSFYGNDRYKGSTIDMSGTDFTSMSFQKVGFGLIDARSKSNVSFNIYNVSNRISVDVRDAELFQNELGDQVELSMDGEVELKNNKKFNQGIGFGFDLDFTLPISYGDNKKAFVRMEAKNIGFAYLYEKQKRYVLDTTIQFSGFEFDQVIGENSIFADSVSLLDSIGVKSTDVNRTVLLPGFIQIGKIVDEMSNRKIQSFFGIRMYPTLIYSPFVYAGIHYNPVKWVQVGANLSYGGFAQLQGGIYTNWQVGNYSIGIGTENVIGLVSRKANGESLYFKLRCAI